MRDRRHFILAAGLTAALAALLGGGWRTAQADELADLRASQALLEQRLNKLAGTGEGHPGAGAYSGPGTVKPTGAGDAGSFPRSFLIPGTHTSVRIGGTIEFDAGHTFTGGTAR